jgi:hypothetical protein
MADGSDVAMTQTRRRRLGTADLTRYGGLDCTSNNAQGLH